MRLACSKGVSLCSNRNTSAGAKMSESNKELSDVELAFLEGCARGYEKAYRELEAERERLREADKEREAECKRLREMQTECREQINRLRRIAWDESEQPDPCTRLQ